MREVDNKNTIRRARLKARDALSAEERHLASQQICDHLLSLLPDLETPIAGYWPIRSEVDVLPLMAALAKKGVPLALPRVISDTEITFHAWQPEHDQDISFGLQPSGFGTFAPPVDAPLVDPRTVLIPLAAFDRNGNRLGYGKGYYDRALEKLRAKHAVKAIGVAYAIQEADRIDPEQHDQRLDKIVTETAVIRSS